MKRITLGLDEENYDFLTWLAGQMTTKTLKYYSKSNVANLIIFFFRVVLRITGSIPILKEKLQQIHIEELGHGDILVMLDIIASREG